MIAYWRVAVAVLGAGLAWPVPVRAHRLDEYLQAARLAIQRDHVDVELDLTAGARVAAGILASIDTDRDGTISAAEGEAYARQVLDSIGLSVDGRPAPIALVDRWFPEYRDLIQGVGTIRLRGTARMVSGVGRHQMVYVNAYRPETSVYMVNALVPTDRRIVIGAPQRDTAQRRFTLTYDVTSASPGAAWWLLPLLAMAVVLATTRRPPQSAA